MVLTYMGRLDEAERAIEAGRQLALRQAADAGRAPALRQADRQSAAIAPFLLVQVARFRPDPGATDRLAQRVAEWAEETGTAWWAFFSLLSLAWAHEGNGRWQEACEAWKQCLGRSRETRVGLEAEAMELAHLSRAHLECGDAGRALQLAEEAVGIGEERGTKSWEIEALLSLSQALRRGQGAGAWPRTREALQRALALVEETGAAVHSPFIREELARWAGPAGDDHTFERELREAHRLYTEMGATGHAERLAKELSL